MCYSQEFSPESSERVFIDGFAARREEFAIGMDAIFQYVVELNFVRGADPCELSSFALVRTNSAWPGNYGENTDAVDEIALSMDFAARLPGQPSQQLPDEVAHPLFARPRLRCDAFPLLPSDDRGRVLAAAECANAGPSLVGPPQGGFLLSEQSCAQG